MAKIDALSKLMGGRLTDDAGHRPKAVGTNHMHGALVIDLARVSPDPDQPRKEFDAEELDNLAASLKEVGQIEPIRVRYDADADTYMIIAGERRYRAAKQAGMSTIQAIVDERDLTADRITVLQLIENALRVDLAPLEAAAAYKALMETWACNQTLLAERLHISQSKISRTLSLLDLPAESQQQVASGKVAPSRAMKSAKPKRQRATTKPKKSQTVQLRCAAGTAVITLSKGSSVVDVLTALLDQEQKRKAA